VLVWHRRSAFAEDPGRYAAGNAQVGDRVQAEATNRHRGRCARSGAEGDGDRHLELGLLVRFLLVLGEAGQARPRQNREHSEEKSERCTSRHKQSPGGPSQSSSTLSKQRIRGKQKGNRLAEMLGLAEPSWRCRHWSCTFFPDGTGESSCISVAEKTRANSPGGQSCKSKT